MSYLRSLYDSNRFAIISNFSILCDAILKIVQFRPEFSHRRLCGAFGMKLSLMTVLSDASKRVRKNIRVLSSIWRIEGETRSIACQINSPFLLGSRLDCSSSRWKTQSCGLDNDGFVHVGHLNFRAENWEFLFVFEETSPSGEFRSLANARRRHYLYDTIHRSNFVSCWSLVFIHVHPPIYQLPVYW